MADALLQALAYANVGVDNGRVYQPEVIDLLDYRFQVCKAHKAVDAMLCNVMSCHAMPSLFLLHFEHGLCSSCLSLLTFTNTSLG